MCLVPREADATLEQRLVAAAERMLADLLDNPDYSSIANPAHQARLQQMLADAQRQGAREVVINPAREALDLPGCRKIAPRLLFDVTDAMSIMQERSSDRSCRYCPTSGSRTRLPTSTHGHAR